MTLSFFDPKPSNPKPLNGSQFSQGTLFQQPKPTDENRYPRGYTPERQHAVSDAIPLSNVYASVDVPKTKGSAFRSRAEYEPPVERASVLGAPYRERGNRSMDGEMKFRAIDNQQMHARSQFVDLASRSTMPEADIRTAKVFRVDQTERGVAGQFHPAGRSVTLYPGAYGDGKHPAAMEESVFTHEIGHSVDRANSTDEVWDKRIRDTPGSGAHPGASPALEGAAEGYSYQHSRQRRTESPVNYSDVRGYQAFHHEPEFRKRFKESSGGVHVDTAGLEGRPESGYRKGLSTGQQEHLFSRDVSRVTAGVEQDFGQHPLIAHWKSQPGQSLPERGDENHPISIGRVRVGGGVPKNVMRAGFKPSDGMVADEITSYNGRRDSGLSGAELTSRRRVRDLYNQHNPNDPI